MRTIGSQLSPALRRCLGQFLLIFVVGLALFSPYVASAQNSHCQPTKSLDDLKTNLTLPKVGLAKELDLDEYMTGIAWSPDGRLLATVENWDSVIKLWDASDFHLLRTIHKNNGGSSDRLLFTADSKYLITSPWAKFDGVNRTTLSIIGVATGEIVKNVVGPHDPKNFPNANSPGDFTLSPDGKLLYVTYNTHDDYLAHIYDTASWSDIGSFRTTETLMLGGPKNDELTLVESTIKTDVPHMPNGGARIWSFAKKDFVQSFEALSTYPASIALDIPTCRLATGRSESQGNFDPVKNHVVMRVDPEPLRIWNLGTGTKLGFADVGAPVKGLAFSPDGKFLAVARNDGSITLHNSIELGSFITVHKFDNHAWRVAFSPDGRLLAVGGDKKVLIYNLKNGD